METKEECNIDRRRKKMMQSSDAQKGTVTYSIVPKGCNRKNSDMINNVI